MRFFAPIGVVLMSMVLASCGGVDSGTGTETTTPTKAGKSATSGASQGKQVASLLPKAERRKLPEITIAKRRGPPPRHLIVEDLREGTGAPVTLKDTILVKYYSVRFVDAQKKSAPAPSR